jgi:hypothetical protein
MKPWRTKKDTCFHLLYAYVQTNTAKPLAVVPERIVLSVSKSALGMSLCQSPHTSTHNRSWRSIFTLPAHLHLSVPFDCFPPDRPIKFLHTLFYLPKEGSVEPKTLPWFPTWKVLRMIGIALSIQWLGYGRDWRAGIRFSTGTEIFLSAAASRPSSVSAF